MTCAVRIDAVVLPRRVLPQPVPFMAPRGDCSACCIGAVTGLSVPEVYAQLNEGRDGMAWEGMRQALQRALRLGLLDALVDDVPMWSHPDFTRAWGSPGHWQTAAWTRYLRMALEAGYYALTTVSMAGGGPLSDLDHAVMLVGVRQGQGGTEVLVSCSSRATPDEEWVRAWDFLARRGGFNLLLARPAGMEG